MTKPTTKWHPNQVKNLSPADPGHPFLNQMNARGLLQNDENIIVPIVGPDGKTQGCQTFFRDGSFKFSGKIAGGFHVVGDEAMGRLGNQVKKPFLFVCENLAAADALNQATGQPAYVAFTTGNLEAVTQIAGKRNPGALVILERDLPMNRGIEAVKKVLETGGPTPWDNPLDMKTAIFEKPGPIPWHFHKRMPKGRGGIMCGIGGTSKTTSMYHMAIGSILGFLPWGWQVAGTGRALLVLTEDTAQDARQTIYYMARDLTDQQKLVLSENLIIYPLAGKDTILMVKASQGTVEKSPLFFSLQQKIIDLGGIVFVGLDPALSITEGDENDQGHQRALGKMADDLAVQTGATVVLVSHAAKGSLVKDELTSHNSRGGGAITDAGRFEYAMRNMTATEGNKAGITDIEERHRHVQLVCTKGNKIPPAAKVPVWLRRDDFGNLSEVDIEMDGNGTLTERDMEILLVHSKIGVFCTPKLSEWRAECIKQGLITGSTENAKTQAMKRVLNKLLKAGLIEKGIGNGIYTQPKEKKEPPF